ncbi:MAG: D-alanyl-D-alanine carboxypeptidase family protein [Candidatus Omnitrophica bacterium]|nr:D-alanyl-D-alanine carboxypeptidase family protein [Candidatus Omnitrophota bacterium]
MAAAVWLLASPPGWALNVDRLEPQEIEILESVLKTLEDPINAKKQDGTAIILSWEALYEPLSPAQRQFLDEFRALKGETLGATSHYFGEAPAADLAPVGPQAILKDGAEQPIEPQYLPKPALEAYLRMMGAMQQQIGKRLLIESGYRSPAYQLYLFLFYMPKHEYSIKETNRFVALPGHSEHGYPPRQAVDFINEAGINGEDHPEAFEALPEFRWLQQYAQVFGFVLSYPKDNPYHTAYEPWHWHFEAASCSPCQEKQQRQLFESLQVQSKPQ